MNGNRLKAELLIKGVSLEDFARYLQINKSTLNRKIRHNTEFKLSEVVKTRQLLGVEASEAIFFSD